MAEKKRASSAKKKPASKAAPTAAAAVERAPVPVRNPDFPIGVDYYPLDEERRSPADWYDRDVDAEFAAIAAARISLVRVYVSWRALEPQVGQYDEDAVERFGRVVDAAKAHDLRLIVCFFADDRLAEMNDVPWGKRRDARTDDYLIQRELSLVQRIVNHYRSEPAVLAWDLGNEAFLTGFTTEVALEKWVTTLREAIREVDPERPILLGVDPETLLRETGVDSRGAIDLGERATSHLTAPYAPTSPKAP